MNGRLVDELGGATVCSERTLRGGLPRGETVSGVHFERCTFLGSVMERARFVGCTFEACEFDSCDLSMVDLTDCRFLECRFTSCKALAVSWPRMHLSTLAPEPLRFEQCRLDLGSFQGMDLSGATFSGCGLREVDFSEAVLRRVGFAESDLSGAVFVRSDLREASFVGASGLLLDVRENRVTGARLDAADAPRLFEVLGLEFE